MDIQTNESVSTATSNNSQKELNIKPKKIIKKVQNLNKEEIRMNGLTKTIENKQKIGKSKIEVFQKDNLPNGISSRKEALPIKTIGNEKFMDLLSKFDKTKHNNFRNKENVNSEPKFQEILKEFSNSKIGIQERMKVYLENANNLNKHKTCDKNQLFQKIQKKYSKNIEDDLNICGVESENEIDLSHDELKISLEQNDDHVLKEEEYEEMKMKIEDNLSLSSSLEKKTLENFNNL